MSGLFLILDCLHWKEERYRKLLCHDAGKLLIWILERYSIPPSRWRQGYCFKGQKKVIPTKKPERQEFLKGALSELHAQIAQAKKDFGGELQLIGLGSLACECLIGGSRLAEYSCTTWKVLPQWRDLGIAKAWICSSPTAALYKPDLAREISGVLMAACRKVGIESKPRLLGELPLPFDWTEYEGKHPTGTG
jgi:hypothetical protein